MDIAKNAEREAAAAAEAKARAEGKQDGKTVKAEAKKAAWEVKKAAAIAKRTVKKTRVMVEDDLPQRHVRVLDDRRCSSWCQWKRRREGRETAAADVSRRSGTGGRGEHIVDRFAEDFGDGDSDVEPDDVDQSGQSGGAKTLRGGHERTTCPCSIQVTPTTTSGSGSRSLSVRPTVRRLFRIRHPRLLAIWAGDEAPGIRQVRRRRTRRSSCSSLDNADVLAMQNWQHVLTLFSSCNQLPKDQHGADRQHVHEMLHQRPGERSTADDRARASFPCAEINALVRNECATSRGGFKFERVLPGALGWAARAVRNAEDSGNSSRLRTPRPSPTRTTCGSNTSPCCRAARDDFHPRRLCAGCSRTSPSRSPPSTPTRGTPPGRGVDGRKRVLPVTERAHFYFRRRIRSVREVHFYSLPDHAGFYAEMLGFLGDGDGRRRRARRATRFSRLDALRHREGEKDAGAGCQLDVHIHRVMQRRERTRGVCSRRRDVRRELATGGAHGNDAFKERNYPQTAVHYTQCLELKRPREVS